MELARTAVDPTTAAELAAEPDVVKFVPQIHGIHELLEVIPQGTTQATTLATTLATTTITMMNGKSLP